MIKHDLFVSPIGQLHDDVDLLIPEPSVCCFLVQIRAVVFLISAGLANLNKKA